MNGMSPTVNITSVDPTHEASVAPWPWPNKMLPMGVDSDKNTAVAGTRKISASRAVFVISAATPARSPSAASLDALESIAVASDVVTSECGRIHSRCALE